MTEQPQHEGHPTWEPYWLTPPDLYKKLNDEFRFTFDPCPFPKPEGYDGTKVDWGTSNYVNPPFHKENGIGPTAFVRKAIEENKKGKAVVLTIPTPSYVNLLLEAGAELRSLGRVRWLHTVTREPMKGPSPITAFILRSRPAPAAQTYIRPEVMAFARAMEDTLRKYDGKKTHWRDVSVSFGYLFGRISDELKEAKAEYNVRVPDYDKCIMELVDTANFCMMCYDKIRPADTRPAPAAQEELTQKQLDWINNKITRILETGKKERDALIATIDEKIQAARDRAYKQGYQAAMTAQQHRPAPASPLPEEPRDILVSDEFIATIRNETLDEACAELDRYYKELPARHEYLDGIDVSIQRIQSLRTQHQQPGGDSR